MYSFYNDYNEIAHPAVMKVLNDLVGKRFDGYGSDTYSLQVAQKIKERLACNDADVHFLNGGTITNLTAISHVLRPHQAVVACIEGHIACHEAGAIEATGHKVVAVPSRSGRLESGQIKTVLAEHQMEHLVQLKMVYLSNSTELGTVYRKKELQALRSFCDEHGLLLYLDGARLASGLASPESDLSIEDLAQLADIFYIGGTKIGAFTAEALVIVNPALKADLRYTLKQKGGLQAKGWLLAAQFDALFEDDLYFKLGKHVNAMAAQLVSLFKEKKWTFLVPPETNQVFVIVPNHVAKETQKSYSLSSFPIPQADQCCLRFCTSWSTTQQDIDKFKNFIKNLGC